MRHHLALIAAAALATHAAPAQSFDLAADWNEGVNPNGVWEYREGSSPLGYLPTWLSVGQGAFANGSSGPGHIPACLKLNTVPAGFDVQVGDVMMHCRDNTSGGSNGEGNIEWTAPQAGIVNVSGALWMARDIGRSVNWILSVNGTAITSGTVASGDPYSRANPFLMSAGPPGPGVLQNIAVNAGDTIGLLLLKGSMSPFGDFAAINWTITYAPPSAAATAIGSGCGSPFVPILAIGPPVIGASTTLALTGGTPNTAGAIFLSAIPAASLPIGAGCVAYLDIPSLTELVPITTNAGGSWSLVVTIPSTPPLAGVELALQGILVPTSGPLGLDLTNGVYVTIGY